LVDVPEGICVVLWNDSLAREHDIDDYYERSSPIIRMIERRRLRIIRGLLAARPGEELIEVGCGGGHVLALFPECRLVGVDVSGAMLEKAKKRLERLDVSFHKGELDELGLAPASFDAAICTEVLEHVVDPDVVLSGIRRLLRPSGRLVVTFPNDALINRGKRVVRKSGLAAVPPLRGIDWGGDRYHLHTWTIPEMRALLDRHFDVVDAAYAPNRMAPIRCCFLARQKTGA
jgi:ubiquinone/menaquinone biosynthesis C-methylase UbiE